MKSFKQFIIESKDEIYNKVLQVTGGGPFDGGCVYYAKSLQKVIGGDLVVLVSKKNNTADHAAVLKNGKMYDFDGSMNANDFIKNFENKEHVEISGYREFKDSDLEDAVRGTEEEQTELAGMIKV